MSINHFSYNGCVFFQGDTVYETVMPEVEEREMEKMVNPIVQEYFEHGDTKEVQVNDFKTTTKTFF